MTLSQATSIVKKRPIVLPYLYSVGVTFIGTVFIVHLYLFLCSFYTGTQFSTTSESTPVPL